MQSSLQAFVAMSFRDMSSDGASTSSEDSFQASIPLRLQLTGSASGRPDVCLQLFSLRHGTACQHVPRGPGDRHNTWTSGTCKHSLCLTCDIPLFSLLYTIYHLAQSIYCLLPINCYCYLLFLLSVVKAKYITLRFMTLGKCILILQQLMPHMCSLSTWCI